MKKLFFLFMTLFLAMLIMNGCKKQKPSEPTIVEPTPEELVQKGDYLVAIMGCNDCHSPKKVGPQGSVVIPELLLSGYPQDRKLNKVDAANIKKGWVLFNEDLTAAAGPWGVSFSANLTSDATGIGNWTEENFKRAMKEGKFKGLPGSRTLLPPMPWANFKNISDEDVKAIFAYLKSTNPVRNVVPAAVSPQDIK